MKLGRSIPAFVLLLSLVMSWAAWAREGGDSGGRSSGGHGDGRPSGGKQPEGRRFDGRRSDKPHQVDRHRHVRPGYNVYIGPAWPVWPYYYDPYFLPNLYYYPPAPPSYPPPALTPLNLPRGYWYYCYNPPGYFPYVQQCFSGWLQLMP